MHPSFRCFLAAFLLTLLAVGLFTGMLLVNARAGSSGFAAAAPLFSLERQADAATLTVMGRQLSVPLPTGAQRARLYDLCYSLTPPGCKLAVQAIGAAGAAIVRAVEHRKTAEYLQNAAADEKLPPTQ